MKYEEDFPIFKTKVDGVEEVFDLSLPKEREKYFDAKVGPEIKILKEFLKNNTFIVYYLAKKSAGKGTYTKLMREIFGDDNIGHISVGDIVRKVHKIAEKSEEGKEKLIKSLEPRYRGYMSLEDAMDAILGRSQEKLLPTELILTLVESEIENMPRKALFIDGLPRDLAQISYALFFRNLIDYRRDPDLFVMIDIPESVIDERMKARVVCPVCQTPRNTKLLATKDVGFDEGSSEFFLKCDEHGERMIAKEGDSAGIESIRERLDRDQTLIDKIFSIHGVPKILLRNAVPVDTADQYVDKYEITPMYSYEKKTDGSIITKESPWSVKDDEGVEVYSLLSPPVVVSLIKNLVTALKL